MVVLGCASSLHVLVYICRLTIPSGLDWFLLPLVGWYVLVLLRQPVRAGPRSALERILGNYSILHFLALGTATVVALHYPDGFVFGVPLSVLKHILADQALLTCLVAQSFAVIARSRQNSAARE
jgi:hypothetical protein